jgi:hypothetical protein
MEGVCVFTKSFLLYFEGKGSGGKPVNKIVRRFCKAAGTDTEYSIIERIVME